MEKLTLDDKYIVGMYNDGKKIKDISKIMGCSDPVIKRILKEKKIFIRGLNQAKVYELEKHLFEGAIKNPLFHYFLGFYVGDGNKGKDYIKKGRFEIGLKINENNEKLLEEIRTFLLDLRKKTKEYTQNQGDANISKYYILRKENNKKYSMLKLRLGFKSLKISLDKWGLKIDKNKCFTIPKYYYSNKENFGIFLAGLIDADGYFNFNKRLSNCTIAIALGDLKSCYNLQKIIKKLYDIKTIIRKEKNYNLLFFNNNHSKYKSLENQNKLKRYVFPYIKLKRKQVQILEVINNGRSYGH